MRTTARLLIVLAAAAVSLAPVTAAGAATNACTWDAGSRLARIDIDLLGWIEGVQVGRKPDTNRIGYAVEGTWTACPTATVTNAEGVVVTGSDRHDRVEIALAGGRLGPGYTAEAKGVSEVEVLVDLGAGTDSVVLSGTGGDDTLRLPESNKGSLNADSDLDVTFLSVWQFYLVGGDGDDVLDGSGARAGVQGGGGGDQLTGGPFGDELCGDCGAGVDGKDVLLGGEGNDALTGDMKGDVLEGGAGDDYFEASFDADGADIIRGGAGTDTLTYQARSVAVTVKQDGKPNDGESGEGDDVAADIERLVGSPADDTIVGSSLDQKISGLAGDDVLEGGAGDDSFPDESGYDQYLGGAGDDYFAPDAFGGYDDDYRGGRGQDTVDFSSRTAGVTIDVTSPDGDGGAGESDDVAADIEVIYGGSADDVIVAGDTENWVYGLGGLDTLNGGGGPDAIKGGDDSDTLTGGEGYDYLYGEGGIDLMHSADDATDYVSCGDAPDDGTLADYDMGLDSFANCLLPF